MARLDSGWMRLLADARTAVLATIGSDGRPRLVPICFVVAGEGPDRGGSDRGASDGGWPILYTPLDEKPKRAADPHALGRVRDILAQPDVTLLVDRWDEDWSKLAWLRLHGRAELLEPAAAGSVAMGSAAADSADERAAAVGALRAKYRQYADHDLESRPLIRIAVTRWTSWGPAGPLSNLAPDHRAGA
jgi:PPOX class probable F420-dependent enzyme